MSKLSSMSDKEIFEEFGFTPIRIEASDGAYRELQANVKKFVMEYSRDASECARFIATRRLSKQEMIIEEKRLSFLNGRLSAASEIFNDIGLTINKTGLSDIDGVYREEATGDIEDDHAEGKESGDER